MSDHRPVRNIVRDLLKDTTVREKKVWVPPPKPPPPPAPTEPKTVGRSSTPAAQKHGPVLRPPIRQDQPTPPPDTVQQEKLDASCEHQWQWKNGVKTCWLCGGPAPQDRRDSSTMWRG